MTFQIVVCIKQVPDTQDIKWTENNTIQREGLDSIINPYDVSAIQFANNFKYVLDNDVIITAVTMGPPQAVDVLKHAIAIGADEAYLLSDKRFAAADTLATAYTLSQFIKNICPNYKLIFCGQQAIDGDTAQTPTSLAEKLDIPQITNVMWAKEINVNSLIWIKETLNNREEIKIEHPCLIATSNLDLDIIPSINSHIKSQNTSIKILNADDIFADVDKIGLKGSPTQVKKAYRPVMSRETRKPNVNTSDDCSKIIFDEISKCRLQ